MAKYPNPKRPYNDFAPRRDDDAFKYSYRTKYVSPATLVALDELEHVKSWAAFVTLCEKQKHG